MDEHRPPLSRRARIVAAGVPAAFLALFFVYPLASILERGLTQDGKLDWPSDVLFSRDMLQILWFTIWQAAVSTALTLVAGLPLAWATARLRFRGRGLVRALVVVPFVLPTVVVATAFLALLPPRFDRGVVPILLAHVFFNIAVVVRIVGGYWARLDPRLWDAAATLGAAPARRFRELTLPALRPALAAAAALAFLFCFTSFGVVVILGGPTRLTLEAAIYDQAAQAFDLRAAAVLSLLQLVAIAIVIVVSSRLEARAGLVAPLAPETSAARPPRGRERVALVAILSGSALFLGAPLLALIERSLATPTGLGLGFFRVLGRDTPTLLVTPWHAVVNSVAYATAATLIALAIGSLAALAAAGSSTRWLDTAVMLPLGASAVMLGYGFLIAFDTAPLDFRGSLWLVPVVQALVATPFVVRIMAPALRAVDPRLRDAAAVLGATPSTCSAGDRHPARAAPARDRSRSRVRDRARRVRRDRVSRAQRPPHPPGRDLPLSRAPRRREPGSGSGALRGADGGDGHGRPRRRAADLPPRGALMLNLENLSVSFDGTAALAGATLEVGSGETVALLGPSGSGKTTLLRAVAGLQPVNSGRIALDGDDLGGVPPHARRIGLMFQEHVLFPHKDVAGNVAFGLRMAGAPRTEIARRVRELLELVGLPHAAERSVQTLSGGEQQRVALARALAPAPRALLLDEPLGSLDGPLRDRLVDDLRALFGRLGLTVVYVTHDVGEAFALGHRVAVMRDGGIVQVATPDDLWTRPADVWVARFLGLRNILEQDGRYTVVRPEAVRIVAGSEATVIAVERRGAVVWLRVRTADGRELESVTTATDHPTKGSKVGVEIDPAGIVDLPPE